MAVPVYAIIIVIIAIMVVGAIIGGIIISQNVKKNQEQQTMDNTGMGSNVSMYGNSSNTPQAEQSTGGWVCTHCGEHNADSSALFCEFCGKKR